MHRIPWFLLVLALLVACAQPAAPSAAPPAATLPTALTEEPPSDPPDPTALPVEETIAPTLLPAPTAVPLTPDSAPALPESTVETSPAPESGGESAVPLPPALLSASGLPLRDGPFDVVAQAAALLPEYQGDLDRAGEWNRYTISATIDLQARTLSGSQRLEYTNRDWAVLEQIYFRLYPNLSLLAGRLDVSAVVVNDQSVEVQYEAERSLLRVDLPQSLAPGETVVIWLSFTTQAPENASSWAYGAFNKESGVFALASAYPLAANVRGGVWDIAPLDGRGDLVNSETALYDVTLVAPSDWELITTGVAIERQDAEGQQFTRIVSGPQRDFTLALTQFPRLTAEVDGTRINSYHRPGGAAGGQVALDAAVRSVRAFNARFGRYPLVELDIVEFAATKFLGVEYPGLILNERTLYQRPQQLEMVTAHEVAHQWWYSLVGNDVQKEAWIDEGLASFSEVVYMEEVYGRAAGDAYMQRFRDRYLSARDAGLDARLDQHNSAFRGNYVTLVYGKSVLFFAAMRQELGEERFDRFIRDFYVTHRYGFVTGDQLLATANQSCDCDLTWLYDAWVRNTAPVVVP